MEPAEDDARSDAIEVRDELVGSWPAMIVHQSISASTWREAVPETAGLAVGAETRRAATRGLFAARKVCRSTAWLG